MTRSPKLRRAALFLMLALLLPAASAAQALEPREPGAESRCPVCGMLVAPHADWLAQILSDDGEAIFFDGAKDLFRYLRKPPPAEPTPGDAPEDAIFVTSYYDRRPIDGREAFYVVGSDILGPMGTELVPHASREAAEEFLADHSGSAVLTFDQVTRELLATLD